MFPSYPGHGREVGEHDQEYRGEEEELEIIREIPGPGCTHLALRPEVVDVQEVPPPVLRAVGGVHDGTEWASGRSSVIKSRQFFDL